MGLTEGVCSSSSAPSIPFLLPQPSSPPGPRWSREGLDWQPGWSWPFENHWSHQPSTTTPVQEFDTPAPHLYLPTLTSAALPALGPVPFFRHRQCQNWPSPSHSGWSHQCHQPGLPRRSDWKDDLTSGVFSIRMERLR